METLTNLMLLSFFFLIGLATIGTVFPSSFTDSANTQINNVFTKANQTSATLSTPGTVNPLEQFGAYATMTTIFLNFISGNHYVTMIQAIGIHIPDIFVYGLRSVNAIYLVITVVYLVGGRLFKGSP